MMKKENSHTPEFDRVMQHAPNTITRYGYWILLALLAGLGCAAWYFRGLLF